MGNILSLQGNDIILHSGSSLDVSGQGFAAEEGPGRGYMVSTFYIFSHATACKTKVNLRLKLLDRLGP